MLRVETKTRLDQDDVMKRALKYFGDHRMKLIEKSPDCATFEGAGGGVSFSISKKDNLTSIELISREWDKQVQDFLELLPNKVIEEVGEKN